MVRGRKQTLKLSQSTKDIKPATNHNNWALSTKLIQKLRMFNRNKDFKEKSKMHTNRQLNHISLTISKLSYEY